MLKPLRPRKLPTKKSKVYRDAVRLWGKEEADAMWARCKENQECWDKQGSCQQSTK